MISTANFIGVIMWHNDIRCRRWRQYCYLDKSRFSVLDWKKAILRGEQRVVCLRTKELSQFDALLSASQFPLPRTVSQPPCLCIGNLYTWKVLCWDGALERPTTPTPTPTPTPSMPRTEISKSPTFRGFWSKRNPLFNWNRWFWGLIEHLIFIQNDIFSLCIVKSSFFVKARMIVSNSRHFSVHRNFITFNLCLKFKWYLCIVPQFHSSPYSMCDYTSYNTTECFGQ